MKIIISRKGFDSQTGGVPSPILPSGELCSLFIPESKPFIYPEKCYKKYEEIMMGEHCLGNIVNDLTRGKIKPNGKVHLDPDLNFKSISRLENWRPIFGQAGAAESHLQNQGVKAGDVFVFFGWFRQVEQVAGRYRYVKNAPNLHIMFGWLQISQRLSVENLLPIPAWASDHPHYKRTPYSKIDSIYVSTDKIELPNAVIDKPGAGTFRRFEQTLCLTCPEKSKRIWQLPGWFHPNGRKSILSYHKSSNFGAVNNEHVLLQSAGRGQEFVLDCEDYPEAVDWLANIVKRQD